MKRRTVFTAGAAGAACVWAAGCSRNGRSNGSSNDKAGDIETRWVGADAARGHRQRDATQAPFAAWPSATRRAAVLVLGAGVAGLAAARAFMRQGIDDVHVLELEDSVGGNARGHAMAGLPCPLGAHYLPLPGPQAREVGEWLHEIGLLRIDAAGRVVADERHLCHSPQERLFIGGQWVEGLLPPAEPGSARLAQYRRFGDLVAALQRAPNPVRNPSARHSPAAGAPAFALPAHRAAWPAESATLDRLTFAAWLDRQGLDDPALRAYLDYCCRDDYGAGTGAVSAWAGVHYFASRHGFSAPGEGAEVPRDAVFTWPEGNAWLTQRLAGPLGAERLHTAQLALAVQEERTHVRVLALDAVSNAVHTWQAGIVVVALPLFVARRMVRTSSPALDTALEQAAAALAYAPWLVANLQLDKPLVDRASGAPPAWDNVIHGARGLGYVDASHQRLSPLPAPGGTVLTAYHALDPGERVALLAGDPRPWAERVLADLEPAHPDLRRRVQRIDLMRYGHAMAIPRPGLQRHPALAALRTARGRVRFAHSDLAGYSVFEEAFTAGCEVALGGLRARG